MNSELEVRLNAEINRAYYTFERYQVIATFTLVYHEQEISFERLGKCMRISDRFIELDENHFFIIYHFTSSEDTYKASQNLLLRLDNYFQNTTTCIAIDNFNPDNSTKVVLNRLKQIIKETRSHSFARIEYEDILDSYI